MDLPWTWHHTKNGPLEVRIAKARTSEGRYAIIPDFSKVSAMAIDQMSTPFNVNNKVMFQLNEAGRKEAKKLIDAEQADLKLKQPRVMLFDDLELITDME